MMLDYALLTKAISRIGKEKPQAKPKVDAAAFIHDVNTKFNTVDKYFTTDPTSLLDSGDAMFNSLNLVTLDFPIEFKEMEALL